MAFWIWVSVFTVAALALLIVPLVRREVGVVAGSSREQANVAVYQQRLAQLEQDKSTGKLTDEEFAAGQLEAQRSLLSDTDGASKAAGSNVPVGVVALACAVALPVGALLLYGQFGDSEALAASLHKQQQIAAAKAAAKQQGIAEPVMPDLRLTEETKNQLTALEADVRRTPLQTDAWSRLAIAYQQAARPRAAADAWGQANTLAKGQNADILLGYAETLALMGGGRMSGEPAALVERAVRLAPESPRALWFGGLVAAESQNFKVAEQRWGALEAMGGHPESMTKVLGRGLQMVRAQLAAEGVAVAPVSQPAPAPRIAAKGDAGVPGMLIGVKLDDAIAAKVLQEVGPNATLFVYAKAQTGPPMPLAIKRLQASQLPVKLALTDRDAMMPTMNLSSVKAWTVIARISPSGSATPQKGDWLAQKSIEGELVDIPPFELVIDTRL